MVSPGLGAGCQALTRRGQSRFDLQEHVVWAAVCPCSWCAVTEPLTLQMAPYGAKDM